jgi:hypothetical protein
MTTHVTAKQLGFAAATALALATLAPASAPAQDNGAIREDTLLGVFSPGM